MVNGCGKPFTKMTRRSRTGAAAGAGPGRGLGEALDVVAARLKRTSPERIGVIAGDLQDAESMKAALDLFRGLGVSNLDCRQDGMVLGDGPRESWLFNSTLAGIEEADVVLLVGSNPRLEAPVFNARLRKRWLAGALRVGDPAMPRALRYAGVGNISGAIVGPEGTQNLVSHNGTLGHSLHRVQEFTYGVPARSLMVLHSDGLRSRWRLDAYPGLAQRDPAVVAAVLSSPELRQLWEDELAGMRDRIRAMRTGLVDKLKAKGVAQDFSFVVRQRGMFSYTGLTAAQVERLKTEFGIYAVSTGRICLAALNSRNLDYVADAIAAVVKG